MNIAEMDRSRWVSNLPQLKNAIRPSFAAEPVADVEPEPFEGFQDAVTEARPGLRLDQVGDRLVPLVFEGDTGWFGNEDTWILRNLGHVLDDEGTQERELLNALDAMSVAESSDSLDIALTRFATAVDQFSELWQQEAEAEQYTAADTYDAERGGAANLDGTPNDTNWNADRTPGTRYFIYYNNSYYYSDQPSGPLDAWATLQAREESAQALAQPWGDRAGASYTPSGNADLYGGDYVYRLSPGGPWLTKEEADRQAGEPAAEAQPATAQPAEAQPAAATTAEKQQVEAAAAAQTILDTNVLPAVALLEKQNPELAARIGHDRLMARVMKATSERVATAPGEGSDAS